NAQGLGFAIPVETAERIANQLFSKGKVEHPYLGIQMVTLTPELREKINLDENFDIKVNQDDGVLIVRVVPGSPAQRAGFKSGDIIKTVASKAVKNATEVQQGVEASEVGAQLEVEVLRNGKTKLITVRPGAFPMEN
ncbi:MAG: PDZ domain-containing protein, partial [Moorea sp. SIO4G2]|nr:PDZ domain-containing protein [Moorena sp. SIO4G2]